MSEALIAFQLVLVVATSLNVSLVSILFMSSLPIPSFHSLSQINSKHIAYNAKSSADLSLSHPKKGEAVLSSVHKLQPVRASLCIGMASLQTEEIHSITA